MFEPFEKDVDKDVENSMQLFERARIGEVTPLSPQRPKSLLLVLDGSAQDETGIEIAAALNKRLQIAIQVLDAREADVDESYSQEVAKRLAATHFRSDAEDNFQKILDTIDESKPGLVVVPCPYGRDLEQLGADSSGTVIDVLLARSPVPLLVVRQPYEVPEEIFQRVLLVLIGETVAAPTAAAWAAGLVAPGGSSELLLILEEEFYANVRELFQAMAPDVEMSSEKLREALTKTHARLHRSLQKTSNDVGFSYDFHVYREDDPATSVLEQGKLHPLLVLALERGDHLSQGHVHDRIRRSPHPVLVVPQLPEE